MVTERELAARVDFALRQLAQQGTQPPARQILEKQLLERTINDRVQMQYARDTGTRVDNAELDRAMVKVAEQNKMTVAELRTVLAKDNVPYDKFREDIRSEITLSRLREREVAQKIVVTESEIDNFIQTQLSQPGRDEFNVSHILITVPEKASPEQLQARRERAEQALAQIKGGTDFRQVAAAFSDGPEALQGGLIGWRETSRLPALFLDAVLPLMNAFGRIAMCGMIAGYDGKPVPMSYPALILMSRLRVQGFIVSEQMDVWPEALKELGMLVATGKLKPRETVVHGLQAAPEAFLGLLKGKNFGKQIVKLI